MLEGGRRIFVSIGSNLGRREENCKHATERIDASCRVVRMSSLYETEPWGEKDQPLFVNRVVEIRTALSPFELLDLFKSIETDTGRTPSYRWGPRLIDLDILFYGDMVIDDNVLTIPHPLVHKRRFVLVPMVEIAPEFVHPVLKRNMSELLCSLEDRSKVRRLVS